VILDYDGIRRWPDEPAVFCDFPIQRIGQSFDDWSTAHDAWMASLSPSALNEMTIYRNDVNKYLRSRAWRACRQRVVDCSIIIMSTLLLGSFLNLFDNGSAEPLSLFLHAQRYLVAEQK